ncbi:MAG: CvpA family protein [Isosphaeraceae bacterium]|nr:CvpA family protein [Isosphaeraceae bacterium]
MTPYDVAMLAVVVAGMVWGCWRGMIWQVASIGSLVLGYTAAHLVSGQLAPHFPGPPVVARALAMLTTYAVVAGGVFLVAWLARETLRELRFEAYDRHMGLVLGGLEGGMLGIVVTLFVTSLAPQTRDPIFASTTGKVVGKVMDAVGPVLPAEIRSALAPHWDAEGDEPKSEVNVVQEKSRDRSESAPAAADSAASEETVGDMIEHAEHRVGKAIADEAEKELQGVVGNGNGRDVERR